MQGHVRRVCLYWEIEKGGETGLGIRGNAGELKKLQLFSELLFVTGVSRGQWATGEKTTARLTLKRLPCVVKP